MAEVKSIPKFDLNLLDNIAIELGYPLIKTMNKKIEELNKIFNTTTYQLPRKIKEYLDNNGKKLEKYIVEDPTSDLFLWVIDLYEIDNKYILIYGSIGRYYEMTSFSVYDTVREAAQAIFNVLKSILEIFDLYYETRSDNQILDKIDMEVDYILKAIRYLRKKYGIKTSRLFRDLISVC